MKKQQKHRKRHKYDIVDSNVYLDHGTNSNYNGGEEECDCDDEMTSYNYDSDYEPYRK